MTSNEIYEIMEEHWSTFKENHDRFNDKGVKAAAVRARKSINELRKLSSKYRSTQLAEVKNKS
jgi:hypothetical protein